MAKYEIRTVNNGFVPVEADRVSPSAEWLVCEVRSGSVWRLVAAFPYAEVLAVLPGDR